MVLSPLLMVFLWNEAVAGVSLDEVPNREWENVFENDELEYEYKNAAISSKDTAWIAVGVRPRGQLGGDQNFSFWKININKGVKVSEVNVEDFSQGEGAKTGYIKIQDLAVTEKGDLLLVLESSDHQVSLMKVDARKEKTLLATTIGDAESAVLIMNIIQTTDRKFLLIGRTADGPLMMKVDEDGNIIWKKTVDDESLSIFLEGVTTGDGGYVLVGNKITISGEGNIWLGKFDSTGRLLLKKTLTGRYGTIAKTKESEYAIVYDQMGSAGWNVFLQGLNPDLSGSWSAELLSGVKILSPFKIASASNGNFIVAGVGESLLSVSRIKRGGEVVWNHIRRDNSATWEKLWNYDMLSHSGEFVIPYTMLVVNKQGEQRQVIKIIKFSEN